MGNQNIHFTLLASKVRTKNRDTQKKTTLFSICCSLLAAFSVLETHTSNIIRQGVLAWFRFYLHFWLTFVVAPVCHLKDSVNWKLWLGKHQQGDVAVLYWQFKNHESAAVGVG